MKTLKIPSAVTDKEQWYCHFQWYSHFGKVLQFLKKLNVHLPHLPHGPAIALPGILPKWSENLRLHSNLYMNAYRNFIHKSTTAIKITDSHLLESSILIQAALLLEVGNKPKFSGTNTQSQKLRSRSGSDWTVSYVETARFLMVEDVTMHLSSEPNIYIYIYNVCLFYLGNQIFKI